MIYLAFNGFPITDFLAPQGVVISPKWVEKTLQTMDGVDHVAGINKKEDIQFTFRMLTAQEYAVLKESIRTTNVLVEFASDAYRIQKTMRISNYSLPFMTIDGNGIEHWGGISLTAKDLRGSADD